jgi:hypothetical protein
LPYRLAALRRGKAVSERPQFMKTRLLNQCKNQKNSLYRYPKGFSPSDMPH